MKVNQTESWASEARLGMTPRPLLVDYSGLRVHRTASEVLAGRAGHRPALLLLAAVFFILMALVPVPGSLVELVERVNPPGYAMMEPGTETIVDSVNYHRYPEAFEAGREGRGDAEAAKGLESGEQVARRAMIMVGILFVAALLWGTEALPIAGTVALVAALMYAFGILPTNEIP
ncbi:MAG: hypothetical protein V3U79_07825, partial [Dehalococcoidia bacterium]